MNELWEQLGDPSHLLVPAKDRGTLIIVNFIEGGYILPRSLLCTAQDATGHVSLHRWKWWFTTNTTGGYQSPVLSFWVGTLNLSLTKNAWRSPPGARGPSDWGSISLKPPRGRNREQFPYYLQILPGWGACVGPYIPLPMHDGGAYKVSTLLDAYSAGPGRISFHFWKKIDHLYISQAKLTLCSLAYLQMPEWMAYEHRSPDRSRAEMRALPYADQCLPPSRSNMGMCVVIFALF